QLGGHAIDVVKHVAVRDACITAFNGDTRAAAVGDVAVDEVRRRIECFRYAERFGGSSHVQSSGSLGSRLQGLTAADAEVLVGLAITRRLVEATPRGGT